MHLVGPLGDILYADLNMVAQGVALFGSVGLSE